MIINGDKAIAAAFVKARAEIGATVAKDTKGNYGKYASLAALTEATTAALAKYNLAIIQEAELSESGVTVETWLIHESGATIQFTPLTMPLTDRKPQAVGSAITYARRYQLGAVCGIAPDDDDGEAAQGNKPQMQRPQAPRPPSAQNGHRPPMQPIEVNMDEVEELDPNPAKDDPATNEEHALFTSWRKLSDAYTWAVGIGACENTHEARNSMDKIIAQKGGMNAQTSPSIMTAFIRRQREKVAAKQPEPVAA